MTGPEVHAELCRLLQIREGRGSKKAVSERLELEPTRYRRTTTADDVPPQTAGAWIVAAGGAVEWDRGGIRPISGDGIDSALRRLESRADGREGVREAIQHLRGQDAEVTVESVRAYLRRRCAKQHPHSLITEAAIAIDDHAALRGLEASDPELLAYLRDNL